MIGFVLAGGYGKRLLPLTSGVPKPFLEVLGRQLIDYSVELIRQAGVKDVIVVTPPGYIELARPRDERVFVVEQRGIDIQGALRTAYEEAKARGEREVLTVYAGFISSPPTVAKVAVDYYSTSGFPVVMALAPVATGLETYGFVTVDYRGAVTNFMPPREPSKAWLGGRGYVFAGVIVTDLEHLGDASSGPFEQSMARLASSGVLGGVVYPGHWAEIGYPWDLLEAVRILLPQNTITLSTTARVPRSSIASSGVVVDEGAVIEEGAIITGPTYIGRRAEVRSGAIIKPYTSIEEGVVVEEEAVVSNSLIMRHARVGAHSEVRSSIIGEETIVEPGAHIVEGTPDRLPERLAWVTEYLGESVKLGSIVAPRHVVKCCTLTGRGTVLE
ncbi:MAG: sugar phosphate nucleotidyltransferase [Acidilobus sp.]